MMKELDARAFASLFREAYQKCFSYHLTSPLTESESNHFSDEILERTGLVIGWKSLKNYSHYVLDRPPGKRENPSVSTLDTLARYVAEAPVTDEGQRKKRESHCPYWFGYRNTFYRSNLDQLRPEKTKETSSRKLPVIAFCFVGMALVLVFLFTTVLRKTDTADFTDDFDAIIEDSLASRGWFVNSMEPVYWQQRDEKDGHLALFTISGDNWPDSGKVLNIKNLLLRKAPFECFVSEVHLTQFFPKQNWQQAGILLLEDTTFTQKSLRMSIGYNDFSGGFSGTREVIIQAVTSLGRDFSKPEEIAHERIFAIEPGTENLVRENLENSALRIERRGNQYRLLYSCGPLKNAAFKEVVTSEFDMQPQYIGIFALKGFVSHSDIIPAYFDFFSLTDQPCE